MIYGLNKNTIQYNSIKYNGVQTEGVVNSPYINDLQYRTMHTHTSIFSTRL